MKEYISKQGQVRRDPSQIYEVISKFSNFSPMLEGKVEDWTADEDTCSFKVKGMKVKLRIIERIDNEVVKIAGDEGSPMEFNFWIQLKSVAPYDTRLRLVLRVELNMMMKMMVGGKLQGAIDQIAEQIAAAFSQARP